LLFALFVVHCSRFDPCSTSRIWKK
jgi:hypothetical protein